MANITNTLIANITATDDTTGNIPINKGTGAPAFDSSAAQLVEYLSLAAGATNIALPVAQATCVYIKNIDPSGHSVQVSWTPHGGVSAVVCQLTPGDQIILWCKPATVVGGIDVVSLTPSAATTLIEYFFGG